MMGKSTTLENMGAIVLAGGKGKRFQGQKQFVELHGTPLWEIVYSKASRIIDRSRIVTVGVDIPGGETRTESVIHGMRALDHNLSRVIILEAARPLVTESQIKTLLHDPYPSSSFVMPLVNTVVQRSGQYLDRSSLYELLTPQAFDYGLLRTALDSGQFYDMTDETRIMFEYWKISPHFIETTDNLIKVTYPKDIHIVEQMIGDEDFN